MIRNENKEIRIATAKSLNAAKTASQTKDIVFIIKLERWTRDLQKCANV